MGGLVNSASLGLLRCLDFLIRGGLCIKLSGAQSSSLSAPRMRYKSQVQGRWVLLATSYDRYVVINRVFILCFSSLLNMRDLTYPTGAFLNLASGWLTAALRQPQVVHLLSALPWYVPGLVHLKLFNFLLVHFLSYGLCWIDWLHDNLQLVRRAVILSDCCNWWIDWVKSMRCDTALIPILQFRTLGVSIRFLIAW